MSWGPQSRSSWRGESLECLHAYGTFKFRVRSRVEDHRCGYVIHFQEGGSLNDILNVSYALHACCDVAQVLLLAWNGRAGEYELYNRFRAVELAFKSFKSNNIGILFFGDFRGSGKLFIWFGLTVWRPSMPIGLSASYCTISQGNAQESHIYLYIHKNTCIRGPCCVYMRTKQFLVHACNNIGKPVLFNTQWLCLGVT